MLWVPSPHQKQISQLNGLTVVTSRMMRINYTALQGRIYQQTLRTDAKGLGEIRGLVTNNVFDTITKKLVFI